MKILIIVFLALTGYVNMLWAAPPENIWSKYNYCLDECLERTHGKTIVGCNEECWKYNPNRTKGKKVPHDIPKWKQSIMGIEGFERIEFYYFGLAGEESFGFNVFFKDEHGVSGKIGVDNCKTPAHCSRKVLHIYNLIYNEVYKSDLRERE